MTAARQLLADTLASGMVYGSGLPVPPNHCVQVDHQEQTFLVKVSSMRRVGGDELTRLIQEKFKVLRCEQVAELTVVLGQ
jgi:hypothetical protein